MSASAMAAGRPLPRIIASVSMCVTNNPDQARSKLAAMLNKFGERPPLPAIALGLPMPNRNIMIRYCLPTWRLSMSDQVERTIRDVTVRIERDACVAFEHCAEEAPEAFQLGDDGVASFSTPENVTKEQLIRACLACPVEALHAIDDNGQEITEEDTA